MNVCPALSRQLAAVERMASCGVQKEKGKTFSLKGACGT
jgi:hypothetical protein